MKNYSNEILALHNAILQRSGDLSFTNSYPSRIVIYQDMYLERLKNAVLADYPALCAYMDCREYISEFVQNTPSLYWDLNLYPIQFAKFLEHRIQDQIAIEIAILESAIIEVFWGEESEPLNPDELIKGGFALRKAHKMLALSYDINTYLSNFRAGSISKNIKKEKNYLFVVRNNNEAKRIYINIEEYQLLTEIKKNIGLEAALENFTSNANVNIDNFAKNLPEYIKKFLQNGFFTGSNASIS